MLFHKKIHLYIKICEHCGSVLVHEVMGTQQDFFLKAVRSLVQASHPCYKITKPIR